MIFGLKSIGETIVKKVAEVKEARAERISKVADSLKEVGKKVDKDTALAMISPVAYLGKKAYDNKDNIAEKAGKAVLAIGVAPAIAAGKIAQDTVKVGIGMNKIGAVAAVGPVAIGLSRMSETFVDKIKSVIDKRKDKQKDNDRDMHFGAVGAAGAAIGKLADKFGFEKHDKDEPKFASSLLSSVKDAAEKINDECTCDQDTNRPEAVGLVGAAGKAVETVAEKLDFGMCD